MSVQTCLGSYRSSVVACGNQGTLDFRSNLCTIATHVLYPVIRLEGDFCGIPMPGIWILLIGVGGPVNVVMELITGTAVLTDRIREFAFSLFLLPVLPFISTLFMILGRHSRRRQVFHIIVLGLAASFALYISTASFSQLGYWALWGIWLYIAVAVCGLILEVLSLLRTL